MIALILGGAPSWAREASEVAALLNRPLATVAANLAGIHHVGRLDAWASLHPDELPGWIARRQGNADYRTFTPDETPERWPGSSGLYAAQVALFEMGASGVILCGVPMDSGAGHFITPGPWASVADYRLGFMAALPVIGSRVRSMSGWTADLFGVPTATWVNAIDTTAPLGLSPPASSENATMLSIKNTTRETRKVWARGSDGNLWLYHIAPGEAVDLDIDKDDPALKGLSLSEPKGRAKAVNASKDAD